MRTGIRRTTLLVVTATTLLVPATVASAAPARPAPQAVTAAATLPPYQTWLADVTTVTDTASRYLATRLPAPGQRPAIVLDIDNTALVTGYSTGVVYPATAPVLAVAVQARQAGAAVFFVTARTQLIESLTRYNLGQVGYPVDGLYLRQVLDFSSDQNLKTNARIAIETLGYTIVANIGNNTSDLAGGHAERTFKLPDYDGLLA